MVCKINETMAITKLVWVWRRNHGRIMRAKIDHELQNLSRVDYDVSSSLMRPHELIMTPSKCTPQRIIIMLVIPT